MRSVHGNAGLKALCEGGTINQMTIESTEKDIQPLNVFFCCMNGGVMMGSRSAHALKRGLDGNLAHS